MISMSCRVTDSEVTINMNEGAYSPDPKDIASAGKLAGIMMARRTELTDEQAFTVFNTLYASLIAGFSEVRSGMQEISPEREGILQELAVHLARETSVTADSTPDAQKVLMNNYAMPEEELPAHLRPGYDPMQYLPEQDRHPVNLLEPFLTNAGQPGWPSVQDNPEDGGEVDFYDKWDPQWFL